MAYNKRRIPRADSALNAYIRSTTAILLKPSTPSNWERLGLTQAQKDGWKALHDKWVATYLLCKNPLTRTSTVLADKNEIRAEFTRFTKDILQYMKHRPGITAGERKIFRVWKDKKTKTRRSSITTAPQSVLKNMEGSWIKLRARVLASEGRPHIHRMADALEIKYSILPFGTTPPYLPSQCTNSHISKRAITTLKIDTKHRSKVLYAFCRWVNLCQQTKSGPWSDRMEAIVA